MSPQAQNSLNLYKGADPAMILRALSIQRKSVVMELYDYCKATSMEDLAIKLSLGAY